MESSSYRCARLACMLPFTALLILAAVIDAMKKHLRDADTAPLDASIPVNNHEALELIRNDRELFLKRVREIGGVAEPAAFRMEFVD